MRVLVTGAAGFIGTNLCDKLTNLGHEVIGLDICDSADIVGDINEIQWSSMNLGNLDGVVHLAAKTSVPESLIYPEKYRETNIDATRKLFTWCAEIGVKKIVFASTAAAYGDSDDIVKKVGIEGLPSSPYAESKILGESIAKEISSEKTNFVCLRFFNVYGKGQNSESGYSAVIPAFIKHSISGGEIIIYGNGKQTRDFVHVSDVSKSIIGALNADIGEFRIINVGTGNGITIIDLAERVQRFALESKLQVPKITLSSVREGDVVHSIADLEGLDEIIEISSMTTLENGLEEQFLHGLGEIEGNKIGR